MVERTVIFPVEAVVRDQAFHDGGRAADILSRVTGLADGAKVEFARTGQRRRTGIDQDVAGVEAMPAFRFKRTIDPIRVNQASPGSKGFGCAMSPVL
jgi:hypothetical protein